MNHPELEPSSAAPKKAQLVVLSGLAGAGKSTAARALEDLGFFVVDNLPPELIETLLQMADKSTALSKIAFVIDAREPQFLKDFGPTWDRLRTADRSRMLLFLDCTDDVLVRRFKETRRRHPLESGDGVLAAIQRERALLSDVSMRADAILDTRDFSVHELKRRVLERFGEDGTHQTQLTIMSFGYKHGLPQELDLCFDVRFLPNPFFVEGLRPLSGLDAPVSQYVLAQGDAVAFLDQLESMVTFLLPRFEHEGKAYVTVAIGCTGGRHRSPALAAALAERLGPRAGTVRVVHRDVARGS
jgi:UPF0042 nucleotide-binding protein